MPEVDVDQLEELLERARAICALARMASHPESAETLRPDTLGTALQTVEDLLGHALAHIPPLRAHQTLGPKGIPRHEGNGG
jgi:hypothetical protein